MARGAIELARTFFQRVEQQFLCAAAVRGIRVGKTLHHLNQFSGDGTLVESRLTERSADRNARAGIQDERELQLDGGLANG